MNPQFTEIPDSLKAFVEEQEIFFVATAAKDGRVNVSPKGMDSLRIINRKRVIWLNVTGSGNETSAHVQSNPRMTMMFSSFKGDPMILRVYGNAKVIHRNHPEWDELFSLFPSTPGARQIFDLSVDLVKPSCGTGVPLFDYVEGRGQLKKWAEKKGEDGMKAFWKHHNQTSLDGLPTKIMEGNT